jgi:hypothetical protein
MIAQLPKAPGYAESAAYVAGKAPDPRSSLQSNPMVGRYRDAYRLARALVTFGDAIKFAGAAIGVVILLSSASASGGPFGGGGAVMAGLVFGAVVAGIFWVCGVLVAAQAQILQASLDSAVAHSPFLTDPERLIAMGLPSSVSPDPGVS